MTPLHETIDTLIHSVFPHARRYIPNIRYVFVFQPDVLSLRVYAGADCVDAGYRTLTPHMMAVRGGFTDLRGHTSVFLPARPLTLQAYESWPRQPSP